MSTFQISSDNNRNSILIRPPINKTSLQVTISEFGLLESNKPIKIPIKNKEAANGSVLSKDVSINGAQIITTQQVLDLLNRDT